MPASLIRPWLTALGRDVGRRRSRTAHVALVALVLLLRVGHALADSGMILNVPDDWVRSGGPDECYRMGIVFQLRLKPTVPPFEDGRITVTVATGLPGNGKPTLGEAVEISVHCGTGGLRYRVLMARIEPIELTDQDHGQRL